MKYAKILGLVAMALAALMALAGTASATVLTSPSGTVYTGTIKAESEGSTELKGEFGAITCSESAMEGGVETHGSTSTVTFKVKQLTFVNCTGGTPTSPVAIPGRIEIHTEGTTSNGNGTVTSKEARIVVHHTLVGTCEFETGTGTDIGVLNGGGPAKIVINGAVVRVSGANILCGSSSTWRGTYKVATPGTLLTD